MSAARALASRAQRPGANRSAAEGETRSLLARPALGHALEPAVRSDFETRFSHDFASIRIHANGEAASAADGLNVRAFTLGDDIVFGRGEYRPYSAEGRALIAHELTHSVQQRGRVAPPMNKAEVGEASGALERQAAETAQAIGANRLPTVSAGLAPARIQRQEKPPAPPVDPLTTQQPSQIMADPLYFENGVKLVRFFGAELAILQYEDGSEFRLGLTPDQIKPPVEAVDYRTTRDQHIPEATSQPGAIRFLPRGKEAIFKMPDTAPFSVQQLDAAIGRNITFKKDAASGRIVPTEVNSLSAPRLCQALREAAADYVKEFDAFAQGGKKVAEKAKLIVEIMGFLPAGQGATNAVAQRSAAKAAATAGAGAESSLAKKLVELIGKKGAKEIVAEGVSFGEVEVGQVGAKLSVRYTFIVNVSRLPNQGKVMQAVLEGAARRAAKEAGAKTAEVAVRTVTNVTWKAYLESQGYTPQMLDKLGGVFGAESAWVKEIVL